MLSSDLYLTIQLARPSDYKTVARLCRRAVGPGDYVLMILKEAIEDGDLFLAWNKRELAGITHYDECIDRSGWLSMARTDPKWRRHGVALALQHHIAAYARRRRIKFLRLWALSGNKASITTCRKAGFKPVCEAAHISSKRQGKRSSKQPSPLNSTCRKMPESLLKSQYVAKMNGYVAYKWYFVKMNRDLLAMLVRKRELYWNGEFAFILTKPEIRFRRLSSSFTPLIGTFAQSLQKVTETAENLGRVSLGSYIPYENYLIELAKQNGYRRDSWGTHCIVFEKRIS
jgi:GNAT superfamily N-acetyltransferase